ncbi:SPFH domain-containing protein, partial [Streptomyces sp. SID4982]|nr:SPFH domain-containing protein [Streptomyces sp. SID4982]
MSTTTPHTPESEDRPESLPGGAGTALRPPRLIHNEATTEIPVHLLFRDEPAPGPQVRRPAVVSRRRGTGEQPRLERPAPVRRRPELRPD